MKTFLPRTLLIITALSCLAVGGILGAPVWAQTGEVGELIKIQAPNGMNTEIYKEPGHGAEIIDIALQDDIFEALGRESGFVRIRLPSGREGYVHAAFTVPFKTERQSVVTQYIIMGVIALFAAAAIAAFFFVRARKSAGLDRRAVEIQELIREAEDLFRAGDCEGAIREFQRYLALQGGEVRNPDVYRRLTVCYQRTNQFHEAAMAWEKMRDLGGLKSLEDYALGMELMSAMGKKAQAAEIYEDLLHVETDKDEVIEIRKKLYDMYHHLGNPAKVVEHLTALMEADAADPEMIRNSVTMLTRNHATDHALERNNKDLILRICAEFLDDKNLSDEAERIYKKCLEYDRTDMALHRMLAAKYEASGDFRNAVSHLSMLQNLDKNAEEDYMGRAARLYVEQGRVRDALSEGNPVIVKKIAQIYLANSEVHSDAVATYEKVLEFQPRAVGVNKMLSTVYLTQGDLEKYTEKLRLLHEIDGPGHDYLSDLAQCVIDNDMIEETIKEGNRELNGKILKQLVKRQASDDKAVRIFEALIRHEPNNAVIRRALLEAYNKRNEPGKALKHVLELCRQRPGDREAAKRAAKLAVAGGHFDLVTQTGTDDVIELCAQELIGKRSTDPLALRVIAEAAKRNPKQKAYKQYAEHAKSRAATQAAPSSESPKRTQAKAPKPVEGHEEAKPAPKQARKQAATAKTEAPADPKAEEKRARTSQRVGKPAAKKAAKEKTAPVKARPPAEEPRKAAPTEEAKPGALPEKNPQSRTEQNAEKPTKETAPAPKPGPVYEEPEQVVNAVDLEPQPLRDATTFVSSHEALSMRSEVDEMQLFRPTRGSMAYREVGVISADGWGVWHAASEVNTGRTALLRIFKFDLLEPNVFEQFVKDVAELSWNMEHENVLRLEEIVKSGQNRQGLVHPYLPRTLEQVLTSEESIDLDVRMELARAIIRGLAYAHNHKGRDGRIRRAFHLHLQPSQILVSGDLSECRIASLGYSQIYRNLTMAKQPRRQEPGMNPAYMPPEFFRTRSGVIKERAAEVYSLGVLLFFILTGELPFEGPSFDDFKFQHAKVFPAPPRLSNPTVPDWIDPLILECLDKNPDKRPHGVHDVLGVIEREMA